MNNKISELTRRNIIDILTQGDTFWSGRMGEIKFFASLFNLEINSEEYKEMHKKIDAYLYFNNDNWLLENDIIDLINCKDDTFLQFICQTIHPLTRRNDNTINKMISYFNENLKIDGFEIIKKGEMSSKPIFSWKESTLNKISQTKNMNTQSLLLAQVAALKKSFTNIKMSSNRRYLGSSLEPLFPLYVNLIMKIKSELKDIYSDLPEITIPQAPVFTTTPTIYEAEDIAPIINNLDYILELHNNMNVEEKVEKKVKSNRIFLSHGRSEEWRKLQAYIEKDLEYPTLELAQEANQGRTILQKLYEEAQKCSIAIIVMTGDDKSENGELRARENVMHEIGFFQGLYGLGNVILLHESDVNIPSNIHGLVYIPFAKNSIDSTFGALLRELKALSNLK